MQHSDCLQNIVKAFYKKIESPEVILKNKPMTSLPVAWYSPNFRYYAELKKLLHIQDDYHTKTTTVWALFLKKTKGADMFVLAPTK